MRARVAANELPLVKTDSIHHVAPASADASAADVSRESMVFPNRMTSNFSSVLRCSLI